MEPEVEGVEVTYDAPSDSFIIKLPANTESKAKSIKINKLHCMDMLGYGYFLGNINIEQPADSTT